MGLPPLTSFPERSLSLFGLTVCLVFFVAMLGLLSQLWAQSDGKTAHEAGHWRVTVSAPVLMLSNDVTLSR
jgi:hypothetical protein